MTSYVLTFKCSDVPGIVNTVSASLLEVDGNITESAQFLDRQSNTFVLRTVFDSARELEEVEDTLAHGLKRLRGVLGVRPEAQRKKVLVMVSKQEHCLLDILFRHRSGELAIDIPLIMSNHPDCEPLADHYDIPYEHVPVDPGSKETAEARLLGRVEELDIDFVVLARYMQILSPRVCEALAGRAINIHHSFLPGFKGARPYHQAYERGVKLIGATAHYVTTDLDEGPIIEQDVTRVSHASTVDDLVRIGRDVERIALSRAVRYEAEDRVALIGSRTVVFA